MTKQSDDKPRPMEPKGPAPVHENNDGRLNDDKANPSTVGSGAMPTDPPQGDVDPGAG